MRARSGLWIVLIAIFVIGAVVSLYLLPRPRNPAVHPRVYSELRALVTGMTIYAQSNQDAFPPPSQTSKLLVAMGFVGPEFFDSPPGAPGEPAFFAIVPAPPEGRWSNSFSKAVPLVYSNPAFLSRKQAAVGYSDGHIDVVAAEELNALVTGSGGHVEPIK